MSAEGNTRIVSRYTDWKKLPRDTVKGNIRTVDNESHRRPDPWHFLVGKEGLFDVTRERYVHKVVKEYPHPNLYLREIEDGVIEQFNEWANSDVEGYAFWGSALFPGVYDANKFEIMVKGYTYGDMKLGTQNAVIVFDGSREDFLSVVKQIFPELENITDPEDVRSKVIFKNNLDIEKILELVKPYLPTEVSPPPITEDVVNYLADLAYQGVDQRYIASEMQRLGGIGKYSFACDKEIRGLSGVMEQNSNVVDLRDDGLGPKKFPCPACGYENTRPFGGYVESCQNPGDCPKRDAVMCGA
jgi:hypothetical protein